MSKGRLVSSLQFASVQKALGVPAGGEAVVAPSPDLEPVAGPVLSRERSWRAQGDTCMLHPSTVA